jgi:hypothetical protein
LRECQLESNKASSDPNQRRLLENNFASTDCVAISIAAAKDLSRFFQQNENPTSIAKKHLDFKLTLHDFQKNLFFSSRTKKAFYNGVKDINRNYKLF